MVAVKERIRSMIGIEVYNQKLSFNGKELMYYEKLMDIGLKNGDIINLEKKIKGIHLQLDCFIITFNFHPNLK